MKSVLISLFLYFIFSGCAATSNAHFKTVYLQTPEIEISLAIINKPNQNLDSLELAVNIKNRNDKSIYSTLSLQNLSEMNNIFDIWVGYSLLNDITENLIYAESSNSNWFKSIEAEIPVHEIKGGKSKSYSYKYAIHDFKSDETVYDIKKFEYDITFCYIDSPVEAGIKKDKSNNNIIWFSSYISFLKCEQLTGSMSFYLPNSVK